MINSFIKKIDYKNYKYHFVLIYFFWLISLILYFFFSEFVKAGTLDNGFKLGNDSDFYLDGAVDIINGNISILKYKSKVGYILFLVPFLYFDLPLYNVVLTQILISSIAAFCLYKITEKYFCKLSGIICIAIFLLYFPLQLRNFYILT